MKKILFILGLIMVVNSAYSQDRSYAELIGETLKTEKKALMEQALLLNDSVGQVFWPLYEEYNENLYNLENKSYHILFEYVINREKITDEKANELWLDYHATKMQRLKIVEKYFNKFKTALPVGSAVKVMQIENKMHALINASIAKEVPIIDFK